MLNQSYSLVLVGWSAYIDFLDFFFLVIFTVFFFFFFGRRGCTSWKSTPAEVQRRRALFWELSVTDCWQVCYSLHRFSNLHGGSNPIFSPHSQTAHCSILASATSRTCVIIFFNSILNARIFSSSLERLTSCHNFLAS